MLRYQRLYGIHYEFKLKISSFNSNVIFEGRSLIRVVLSDIIQYEFKSKAYVIFLEFPPFFLEFNIYFLEYI